MNANAQQTRAREVDGETSSAICREDTKTRRRAGFGRLLPPRLSVSAVSGFSFLHVLGIVCLALVVGFLVGPLAAGPCLAQVAGRDDAAYRSEKAFVLANTSRGRPSARQTRIAKTDNGFVRSVGYPSGRGVEVVGADASKPEDVAARFLEAWGDLFVNPSDQVRFDVARTVRHGGRSYVHLGQRWGDLPVFGAEMIIQVAADGRVNY